MTTVRRDSMELKVVDKQTGRIVWNEVHDTEEAILKAIEDLKRDHFNPRFFNFIWGE